MAHGPSAQINPPLNASVVVWSSEAGLGAVPTAEIAVVCCLSVVYRLQDDGWAVSQEGYTREMRPIGQIEALGVICLQDNDAAQ